MLPRANRVVRSADFRTVVRRGRRMVSSHAVVYVLGRVASDSGHAAPSRFGFVVTKAVGNAVLRNLVRRRLREVCRGALPVIGGGSDIVVRALPGSPEVDWVTLQAELIESIGRGVVVR